MRGRCRVVVEVVRGEPVCLLGGADPHVLGEPGEQPRRLFVSHLGRGGANAADVSHGISIVLADEHLPLALVAAARGVTDVRPTCFLDHVLSFAEAHKTPLGRSRAVRTRSNVFGVASPSPRVELAPAKALADELVVGVARRRRGHERRFQPFALGPDAASLACGDGDHVALAHVVFAFAVFDRPAPGADRDDDVAVRRVDGDELPRFEEAEDRFRALAPKYLPRGELVLVVRPFGVEVGRDHDRSVARRPIDGSREHVRRPRFDGCETNLVGGAVIPPGHSTKDMDLLANLTLVFVAGLVTALATGLGAVPFFLVDDVSDRWNVALWGLASGIMVSASVFGLIFEGLAEGTMRDVAPGLLAGVVLVVAAHRVISGMEVDPHEYEEADFRKLVLILGVLTVHSFPEGVAVGVSFADLNVGQGPAVLGFTVPVLAIFMTVAISIHNVPEGVAVSIPLRGLGVSEWKMVWWAVFSSLPQPIGAVLAFAFVRVAREFLPFGFGFAAGAMIYLVVTEFIPEALSIGASLPDGGRPELIGGLLAGVTLMLPLAFV